MYSKHPSSMETGAGFQEAKKLYKGATNMGPWIPTVVNPAPLGSMKERVYFWTHVAVWVATLVLSCLTNFTAKSSMKAAETGAACLTDSTCYTGITDTANRIAITGSISTILGVLALVGCASFLTADEYKTFPVVWEKPWALVNPVVTFLTVYGAVSGYYVLMLAAKQTTQSYFMLALITTVVQTYSQILLYSTSAALDVLMLPGAFLPSIGASVQFISALLISSGDFKSNSYIASTTTWAPFSDDQKMIAWLVPIFTFVSFLVMMSARTMLRVNRTVEGPAVSPINMKDQPFIRSVVLTLFFAAGVLSVYKLSFMTVSNDNPVAYIFALIGVMFNFMILSVVFIPGSNAFGVAS